MRIGVNLTYLVPGETGGSEIYARRLLPELAALVGSGALTLFVSPELAEDGPLVADAHVVRMPVRGRTRVRRTAAEQALLPVAVRRAGVDVLHNLASTASALSGAKAMVTTVLDLIYLHDPATHGALLARGMSVLVPLAARRSDRLIAISAATRDDLVASLGAPDGKIDVVHLGPGLAEDVTPTPEPELRARLGLGDAPVLLTPSARRSHKNLPRWLEAFALVTAQPAPVLVLPGYATGAEDALVARARELGVADRVAFCGWVSDEDLDGLYACATALVFPSLFEGFGLPVLEAMRRGLPVACADRTSLPEIAGGAALLFDPESVDAMAGVASRLLVDPALRDRLSAAGRARAEAFSWRRAARETLDVYERALA
jgi:glycosyltransferase involved in cell wall biosynthesis